MDKNTLSLARLVFAAIGVGGAIAGFTTVSGGGQSCGSVFSPESYSVLTYDGTPVADPCGDRMSSRKTLTWVLLGIGAVGGIGVWRLKSSIEQEESPDTDSTTEQIPPGWYTRPERSKKYQHYWDGRAWDALKGKRKTPVEQVPPRGSDELAVGGPSATRGTHEAPASSPTPFIADGETKTPKRPGRKVLIGGGVVIACLVAGVAIFLATQESDTSKSAEDRVSLKKACNLAFLGITPGSEPMINLVRFALSEDDEEQEKMLSEARDWSVEILEVSDRSPAGLSVHLDKFVASIDDLRNVTISGGTWVAADFNSSGNEILDQCRDLLPADYDLSGKFEGAN